jgi:subtilisin family serine protease
MDSNLFDFISNPETVDFIVRNNEFFRSYIESKPEIRITQEIGGRYLIGYAPSYFINTLVRELGSGVVSGSPLVLGLLDRANLDAAGIIQVQQQPFLDLKGRGVLVAIVDTGIDYTNKAFRYEDGSSKIQFLFDQTINTTPPPGFFFGTEYTKEQIDVALNSANPYEIVPSRDTVGHGTFLASVACGREDPENPQFIGAAPDSELIVVKLRPARNFWREQFLVPPEQENAFESTSVMIGIEYILQKSQELKRPVSICLALGTNSGGHDGFTLFEEYLTATSIQSGVCISMAAGNESEARHHTQGVVTETGASTNIEIRVGERAGNVYMNIWNTASDRLEVAIRSPTGELVSRVPAKSGTVHQARLVLERSSVIVEYYFPVEVSGG